MAASKKHENRPSRREKLPERPTQPERTDTHHSRYVQMLLKQDHIPRLHNILAAFFVWLLLAGFLVFPGTFTSIRESIDERENDESIDDGETVSAILKSVKNVPLLVIAAVSCVIAAIGMISLALRHMRNYVWLINRLLVPGMANSLAGLISTLIAVYTQKNGNWSVTAQITAIVEGSYLFVCAVLFIVIERYLLQKVKAKHGTHYDHWFGATDPIEETVTHKGRQKRQQPETGPENSA